MLTEEKREERAQKDEQSSGEKSLPSIGDRIKRGWKPKITQKCDLRPAGQSSCSTEHKAGQSER